MENAVMIEFRGWVVDIFETGAPNRTIGITVEKAPHSDENPPVDIFVEDNGDQTFHVRSPDAAADSGARMMQRARAKLMDDGVSTELAFSLLLDALEKQCSAQYGTNIGDVLAWSYRTVAALRGHLTEQGTTHEQNELLKKLGCPYL